MSMHGSSRIFRPLERPEIPALLLLFILALVVRLDFLFTDIHARGTDGYYYAAQVKHYLERGSLFGSDSSLILYWLIGVNYISGAVGLDIVASNKIAAALLGSLVVFPAYLLGRNLSPGLHRQSGREMGLLLAAFYTATSAMAWFHLEFVKNLGGILFFLFFAAFLIKAIAGNRSAVWACAVFLVLTLLSHKLMGGFALIFAGLAGAFKLFEALKEKSPGLLRFLLIGGAVMTILFVCLSLIFPGVLHYSDFSRFENLFIWPPRFHIKEYIQFIRPPWNHRWEFYAFAFAPVPALLILAANGIRRRYGGERPTKPNGAAGSISVFALFLVMYGICMNPILRFKGLDFSFRLLIVLFIPAGYFLIFVVGRLPMKIGKITAFALVLIFAAYQMPAFRGFPARSRVNYALYADIVPLLVLPEDSLLIAHQGLDNFYYYKEGKDALRFMPEEKYFRRPVFRMAWGIDRKDLRKHLGRNANIRFLPGRYILLRESDWRKFIGRLPASRRGRYRNWRNPYRYRAGFMRKGR